MKNYQSDLYIEYEGELFPLATESDWDSAALASAIEWGPVPEGRLVGQPTKWALMDSYGDVFAIADRIGGVPEEDE